MAVGMVPYEPELVQLANGDVLSVRTWPCWGMDIKYGKNTDISYGPWADRQRLVIIHTDELCLRFWVIGSSLHLTILFVC